MEIYKCWGCGKDLEFKREPQERIYCEACITKKKERDKKILMQHKKLKSLIMYERALAAMENAGCYMHEYQSAARKVQRKVVEDPNRFFSSDEIITAIVLLEYGYQFGINYPVGKYRVDFYIPEIDICLEIDGDRHKYSGAKDKGRDIEIRNMLGLEWEIVRIPTEYVESKQELLTIAIEKLAEEQRKLRKENSGLLPDNYSIRERSYYSSLLGPHPKKTKRR